MSMYEGMFIFADGVDNESVDVAVTKVKGEIEVLGGKVVANTRLGRRQFARTLNKRDAGQYAVITFELDGLKVDTLRHRLRLSEDVFRCQIVKAQPAAPVAAAKE